MLSPPFLDGKAELHPNTSGLHPNTASGADDVPSEHKALGSAPSIDQIKKLAMT